VSERLTNERLASINDALAFMGVNLLGPMNDEIRSALSELQERRDTDLSDEDREALEFAWALVQHSINEVREKFGKKAIVNPLATRAAALLDRLTKAGR
jgi:hypothetical protein